MTPRKPRKMPKNQRAYKTPKGVKMRLMQITDLDELRLLFRDATEIGTPVLYQAFLTSAFYCDANKLRLWRAFHNPPTSGAAE